MKACRMPIGFAVVILVFTTVVKAESESDVRFCDPHHLFHVVIPSDGSFKPAKAVRTYWCFMALNTIS